MLAQVEPGEIRSRLPASPPEQGEPFSAVLRDLDEVLLPGMTHWQHPRFFAYFANSASRPGILAEMLAAALNPIAFLWRTSPASTELEGLVCDWAAQLLGLPDGWHGHIEDAASTSTMAAMIAARHATGRNVAVGSEHAHSALDKGARMLGMELRKVPADDEFRMRVDGARPVRRRDRRADGRDDLDRLGRPGARRSPTCASRPARGCTSTPPTRARDGVRGAPLGVRGRRARGLARRQRAQVAAHADGLLDAVDEPPARTSAPPSASSPSSCARPTPRTRSASASTARRSGAASAR